MASVLSLAAQWGKDLSEVLSKLTWPQLCGLASAGLLGQVLWSHYRILLRRRLPPHDLGVPLLGHTFGILKMGLERWALHVMEGKQTLLSHYFFTPAVIIRHEQYMKHIHRSELNGELCPLFPRSFERMIGENSVINLPGGKGHPKHKRLRGKLLASLGPQYVLSLIPEIAALVRLTLDGMVKDTERQGYAEFQRAASELAARASVLPIAAGLEEAEQRSFEVLLNDVMTGLLAPPLDLGRFSAHGRALIARRKVCQMISKIMAQPKKHRQNIIADLMKDSEDGKGFTEEEISDTVFTLLIAGKLTTADALPCLLVQLYQNTSWNQRVAAENLEMKSPEEDSVTLRVVRESLRFKPPVGAFRRVSFQKDTDLGEHGVVPMGCPMAILFSPLLKELGDTFDPDRWLTLDKDRFLVFGGHQPHECIGKHLALVELQLFARILCRDYDFEVLDTTEVVDPSNPVNVVYKDGCRVKISKK
ncbi:unnamed protein product [Symbiodinium natans]|uniref:Cytochrome P450 n=1 Tax=Symbiodinium natans TaxID=878477 RepID=A0A812UL61_9DINO|nr:unnamed protein product [Symbiodinium natans]